jgi:putative transposase
MSGYEVADRFWEQAQPLLEPFQRRKPGGSAPLDFRRVMNGSLYVRKSGCQWHLLPRCYGSKSAVHEHFQRWVAGGVFTALFRLGAESYEELCGCAWAWQSMDGSLVPAPVRQTGCQAAEGLGRNPTDAGGAAANCTSWSTRTVSPPPSWWRGPTSTTADSSPQRSRRA